MKMKMKVKVMLVSVLLLLLVHAYGHNKFISQKPTTNEMENKETSFLVSDGVHNSYLTSPKMDFTDLECVKQGFSSESSCEQTYGVLPCTTSIIGNLFLMGVYGFFMFKAATFLGDGSELLLEVMGPGIVGGLVLPILGSLPDALLIFVSGMSGTKETAQQQVLIGMGLLAGSIVMLLTALWGSCLIVGKCDLSAVQETIASPDTKCFNLEGSGITVDKETREISRIMMATVLPFVIAQIPSIFHLRFAKHVTILIAFIIALLSLLGYCIYQILKPWVQKSRLSFLRHRHVMSSILKNQQTRHGALIKDNGEPNVDVIHKVFANLDVDDDKRLTLGELRGLIVGLEIDDPNLDLTKNVKKIMQDFDVEKDGSLTREEFTDGMCKWIRMATSVAGKSNKGAVASEFHMKSKEELEALLDSEEESPTVVDNKLKVYLKAGLLLLGGVVIAGVFADPLVDAVDNFSGATNIPSFFISFIAMPLANSSDAISALFFVSQKKKRTASLAYSMIYGSVTMKNTMCLAVFMAVVYVRDLDWDFSAEILVILLVIVVTGTMASINTTFKLWMSIIALLMYPLSLIIVYVLDFILGWS